MGVVNSPGAPDNMAKHNRVMDTSLPLSPRKNIVSFVKEKAKKRITMTSNKTTKGDHIKSSKITGNRQVNIAYTTTASLSK